MSRHVPSCPVPECLTRRLEDLSSGLAQKPPSHSCRDFSRFQHSMFDGQKHPETRNSRNMSEQIKVPNWTCPLPRTLPAGHPGPLSTPHCGGLGEPSEGPLKRIFHRIISFENCNFCDFSPTARCRPCLLAPADCLGT